ncbi:MAG: hypothetical protein V4650_14780 [Pseudomonadota bacterium]
MSKKFLPLAGFAALLAIICYVGLSFLFPHKKAEVVVDSVNAEAVFGAALDESGAQATASTSPQSDAGIPASGETTPVAETPTETAVDGSATEVPVEVLSEAPAEVGSETPVETASETPSEPVAAEAPVEAAPVETAEAVEPVPEPAPAEETPVEAAPVEETPAPAQASSSPGLSREQLARIVAEAAAKAAAETARSIAEQAARDAASR